MFKNRNWSQNKVLAKTQNFSQKSKRSRKIKLSIKQKETFWSKVKLFVQKSKFGEITFKDRNRDKTNFGQKPKLWSKIGTLTKIKISTKKETFWSKIEIVHKANFWSNIETFGQKSKLSLTKIFLLKIEDVFKTQNFLV